MPAKSLWGALLAATVAATPLLAQTSHAAVDAVEKPVTQNLNAQVAASSAANAADAANAEAQYEADRAAYMAALVRHDAAVNRTDARYERQQRAYADAMAAWRLQVAECTRGNRPVCDMPAPNPADFY